MTGRRCETVDDTGAHGVMTAPGRNILIVEDDQSTLAGWVELLRGAGYFVRGVSSYEEGRQELAAMPDAGGLYVTAPGATGLPDALFRDEP